MRPHVWRSSICLWSLSMTDYDINAGSATQAGAAEAQADHNVVRSKCVP